MLSFIQSYYCTKEKTKIVQFYFETKTVVLTQRRFRVHFKVKTAPSRNTILSLTEKMWESEVLATSRSRLYAASELLIELELCKKKKQHVSHYETQRLISKFKTSGQLVTSEVRSRTKKSGFRFWIITPLQIDAEPKYMYSSRISVNSGAQYHHNGAFLNALSQFNQKLLTKNVDFPKGLLWRHLWRHRK